MNSDINRSGRSDSVSIYLQQMGRVPLLTHEEETAIAKKIERAEKRAKGILYRFRETGLAYLNIAASLLDGSERFDRIVAEKRIADRASYLRDLPGLCLRVRTALDRVSSLHERRHGFLAQGDPFPEALQEELESAIRSLARLYARFRFKRTILERLLEVFDEQRAASDPSEGVSVRFAAGWLLPAEVREYEARIRESMEEAQRAKAGFIQANLRFVISVAKRYSKRGLSLLDLIQEGNIGLMKAVERFDYRQGYKFSTYGAWWIRQEILRALVEQTRTIRLPSHLTQIITKLAHVEMQLVQDLGREPTLAELADEIHLPVERVRALRSMAEHPVSLQSQAGAGEESCVIDFVEDVRSENPMEETALAQVREQISKSLFQLTERERYVLEQRFGLVDGYSRTLEEVGQHFKVTRERIRQIEAKALDKMRHPNRRRLLEGHLDSAASGAF